ncbi:folate/biopterin family MFS transporter [Oscillospiraceae bacterium HV4-5-C5C]|nr:folate/biopterin family MFS transporter [Oscillospiraceae bacterium HV4-5-C5C]
MSDSKATDIRELTLDQRKMENFKSYFYLIEAVFYFLQGIYVAGIQVYITYYTTKVFMLDYVTIATITATISVPTYLKMFTGLFSDRVPIGRLGRRKPYLFLGGILFIPAFIGLASIKEYSEVWLAALVVCFACFVIVDGTADALTVDVTPDEYASKMQGYANGGRYAGMAVGVIFSSILSGIIGWNIIIFVLALAAIGQAFVTLLFKEVPGTTQRKDLISIPAAVKLGFGNWGAWLGLLFAMCFMGAMGLANIVGPLVMNNTNQTIYGISTMVNYIAIAATAFVVGQIINKVGGLCNRNIWIMFGLIWVLLLPWLLVDGHWSNTALVIVANLTMGMARGIVTVITYAVLMRLCSDAIEGFMFAVFTSVMNIGLQSIAPKVIAYFGQTLNWGMIPALFTMLPLMLIGILTIPGINRSVAARLARETPPEAL